MGKNWRDTGSAAAAACARPSACVAVGSAQGQSSNQVTLGAVWNGTDWVSVKTTNP